MNTNLFAFLSVTKLYQKPNKIGHDVRKQIFNFRSKEVKEELEESSFYVSHKFLFLK